MSRLTNNFIDEGRDEGEEHLLALSDPASDLAFLTHHHLPSRAARATLAVEDPRARPQARGEARACHPGRRGRN
jgi:hypothetical protein